MRGGAKIACLLLLLAAALSASPQDRTTTKKNREPAQEDHQTIGRDASLTNDDRLSLIAAALDFKVRNSEPDCSHMVHAIYQQAGLPYVYAPSSDLYAGVDSFRRVKQPEPGDLVAWRGHVGIVVKPSQHLFFSVLSSGPGVDDYTAAYWKRRGKPRFYRYVKSVYGPQPNSPKLLRANQVHPVPESDNNDQ